MKNSSWRDVKPQTVRVDNIMYASRTSMSSAERQKRGAGESVIGCFTDGPSPKVDISTVEGISIQNSTLCTGP